MSCEEPLQSLQPATIRQEEAGCRAELIPAGKVHEAPFIY